MKRVALVMVFFFAVSGFAQVKYFGSVNVNAGASFTQNEFYNVIVGQDWMYWTPEKECVVDPTVGFDFISGVKINSYFKTGLGVGFFWSNQGPNYKQFCFPVFAYLRADFLDKKITPFADLRLGYSFHTGHLSYGTGLLSNAWYSGGLYMSPGVGVSFKLKDRYAIDVALMYSYNSKTVKEVYVTADDPSGIKMRNSNKQELEHHLALSVGFSF